MACSVKFENQCFSKSMLMLKLSLLANFQALIRIWFFLPFIIIEFSLPAHNKQHNYPCCLYPETKPATG